MSKNMTRTMKSTPPEARSTAPTQAVKPTPERRMALARETETSTASSTRIVTLLSSSIACSMAAESLPTALQALMSLMPSR